MLLALVAGCVEQNAASDYSMLGDRLNRALLQTSDRRLWIVAIVQMVTIPGMAECIVLSSALGEHRQHIIGILQAPRKGLGPSADIETLVHSESMDRLRADRMSGVALGA